MGIVPVGPRLFPEIRGIGAGVSLLATGVINAAGAKVVFVGRVWWPGVRTGTKNLSRVQFRFGAVTKTGGTGLTVSQQDVSTTAGPPMQPDGTADQTVAIANGAITANSWYRTGTFNTSRTVSQGDYLAVVVEPDGSGYQTGDSIVVNVNAAAAGIYMDFTEGGASLYNGSAWSVLNGMSSVLLEFDDGSFGTLGSSALPGVGMNSVLFNSGTSDERGLRLRVPYDVKIDGLAFAFSLVANAACDLRLWQGQTSPSLLETVSLDANMHQGISAARINTFPIPERTLVAGTTYYLTLKPTTANNVNVFTIDVNANSHLAVYPGGIECYYGARTSGDFTDTNTKVPLAGVRISGAPDGTGGGGSSYHNILSC
jgi:hypothetical protein